MKYARNWIIAESQNLNNLQHIAKGNSQPVNCLRQNIHTYQANKSPLNIYL